MNEHSGSLWDDQLQKVSYGAHICNIYHDHQEQSAVIVSFLAQGIERNERCLYIADQQAQQNVSAGLRERGVDVGSCRARQQLLFPTIEETYLRDGFFSPLRMLELIQEAHYGALRDGFQGLRGSGDLSSVTEYSPRSARVLDYERQLNVLLAHYRLLALCQYSEETVSERMLFGTLLTHPCVLIGTQLYDNVHYVPVEKMKAPDIDAYVPGAYRLARDRITGVGLQ